MNRCDVLRGITDDEKLSEMVYELSKKADGKESLRQFMTIPFSENELQTVQSIAQSDYPLSLSGRQ